MAHAACHVLLPMLYLQTCVKHLFGELSTLWCHKTARHVPHALLAVVISTACAVTQMTKACSLCGVCKAGL